MVEALPWEVAQVTYEDASMTKPTPGRGRRCAGCGTALAADNTATLCSRCHRETRDELASPPRLPESFFDTDEFRAAFESHHMGKVFRAYRNHPRHLKLYGKALNQELLGRWLGLAQAQVSKLENGKPEHNLQVLQAYAKVLHLPPRLLWFALPGQSRIITRYNADLNQEEALMAASEESGKFFKWAQAGNVDELTIEEIHAEIRSVAHSYLKAPTMPLFERTRKLRDRVFGLLSGHPKPTQARELYSAAGWSLTILAWISTDLGRPAAAEDHLDAAWLCAERAEQDNLRAWVRATQHTAAFWQNDFWRAARYAEDGLRYATNGTAELYLSSAWALDLARYGDGEAAKGALERAQNAASLTGRVVQPDELTGPFTCSIGRAGGFWSDTYLELGDAASALRYADQAVSAFEATPSGVRNLGSERMVRCQQVKSHILLGELEGAVTSFEPVIETAPEHRVGPLAQRVREITQMVSSRTELSSVPIATQIKDAAIEFQRNRDEAFENPPQIGKKELG
jgi:transcriptional regulator with XRE-family HTH domain